MVSAAEIPTEFFIFVDQASFDAQHNLALTGTFMSAGFSAAFPSEVPVGTMTRWSPGAQAPREEAQLRAGYLDGSLDYLPYAPNDRYFGWPTPFVSGITTDYRVEHDAEVGRRVHAPLLPSRLSATYAFGDMETCRAVSAAHGWSLSEVRRFRLRDHPHVRVARVNMEIVSLARVAYRRGTWSPEQLDSLWKSYWGSTDNISLELPIDGVSFERRESGTLWEYLVEGALEYIG